VIFPVPSPLLDAAFCERVRTFGGIYALTTAMAPESFLTWSSPRRNVCRASSMDRRSELRCRYLF